jgi:hypothetical protein
VVWVAVAMVAGLFQMFCQRRELQTEVAAVVVVRIKRIVVAQTPVQQVVLVLSLFLTQCQQPEFLALPLQVL